MRLTLDYRFIAEDVCAYNQFTHSMLKSEQIARYNGDEIVAGWPSGLRRCVQVAVSSWGVGSNPTPVKNARLAQSVERWTLNPTVVGSSPTLGDVFLFVEIL